MDFIINDRDFLSRIAAVFAIPFPVMEIVNSHLPSLFLQGGETIRVPGYWVRTEYIDTTTLEDELQKERIQLMNPVIDHHNRTEKCAILSNPVKVTQPIVDVARSYNYHMMVQDLNLLRNMFPFLKVKTIGRSVLGKDIIEIKIGKGKKKVHLNASFHANEWITSLVLMKWLNDFLVALVNNASFGMKSALELFLDVDLSIVPMVNPDGVDLVVSGPPSHLKEDLIKINGNVCDFSGWKANIRGVDLNNQFPANWEIEKERKIPKAAASRDFPGVHPLTEPEACTMANLVMVEKFDRVVALHTQGKELYWGYQGHEPEESRYIALELERRSGYQAIQTVDSHAGFKDWFIQEFKKPGFTIELGKGINPLPLSQFPSIFFETKGLLDASIYI